MLPAFANAGENSELAALVSGDPKKLATLGKKYGVDQLYGYEQFTNAQINADVFPDEYITRNQVIRMS